MNALQFSREVAKVVQSGLKSSAAGERITCVQIVATLRSHADALERSLKTAMDSTQAESISRTAGSGSTLPN